MNITKIVAVNQLFSVVVLLVILLGMTNCNNDYEQVIEEDEFGNVVQYNRNKLDYAREGWAVKTTPKGDTIEVAHYVADTLDGRRMMFFENGDTSIVETYQKGMFHGAYKVFYKGGMLMQLGNYTDNEMSGVWTVYYDDGQLKEKVQFENNEENGPFVEYHPNGNMAAEGHYLNGDNEHGELKVYDESGTLIRKMQCEQGRCKTLWAAENNNTDS